MAFDFPSSPTFGQKFPASPIAGIPTYTWDGEKWTTSGASIGQYVAKAGDTMTGPLVLPADPTLALQASTKQYVDGRYREKLTANRTYYVRTDGSNANNGLANTAGGAFLTLQYAVDICSDRLDLAGNLVTIQVSNGTYTGSVSITKPFVGNSSGVTIFGDTTTPSNVLVSVTGPAITVSGGGVCINLSGLKIVTASSGNAITATTGGVINLLGNMEFGACAGVHIQTDFLGKVALSANYSITGAALAHYNAVAQGQFSTAGITVTGSGALAFSVAFALCSNLGLMYLPGITFSGTGSFTGLRYIVSSNSVAFTNGGGANYFPGNVAGSVSTGGQYV